jgi:uncharacterized membrane protein (UPF0127 family)
MKDGDILTFDGHRNKPEFRTEVVISEEAKRRGLMFRDRLPPQTGMFFVYQDEPQRRNMWMPNMRFPLDIVWLDSSLKIVSIRSNVEPCPNIRNCPRISSIYKCQYAIEFPAGEVEALGLRIGDVLHLRVNR